MRPREDDIARIAEQAWLMVGGNPTKDSRFNRPEIELLVRQAVSKLFQTRVFENYKIDQSWDVPGEFMVNFANVPVLYDQDRLQSFINSPSQFVNLPKSKGVYSIAPMQNPRGAFIPVPANSYVFEGTRESKYLQGNIGYIIEGRRIYFTIDIFNERNINELLVRLVTGDAPSELLMIPADMEADIIQMVLGQLKESGKTDQEEDNVDQS